MHIKLTKYLGSLAASSLFVVCGLTVNMVADKLANHANVSASFGSVANAQTAQRKPRRLPGIGAKFVGEMGKVEALVTPEEGSGKKPDLRGAKKLLDRMERGCKGKSPCNGNELANLYRYFAIVSYELDDIKGTARYFELVLNQSPNIPWALEEQISLQLAKIFASEEQYKKAIKYIDKYMSIVAKVSPDAFYTKATICYQMDDSRCALDNVNKAVSLVEKDGGVAKEQWYNLQRGIYNQRENYKQSLKINRKLVLNYPKASYWNDLGSFYSQLDDFRSSKLVLDSALSAGILDSENQYLQLAQILFQDDLPYNAAETLRKGVERKVVKRTTKNLERLGRYYYSAKEYKKSIKYMTQAGDESDTGDIYADIVGIYVQLEDMKGAVAMGGKALKKRGGLKKPGRLHFQMGTAYFEMKQFEKAIKSFEKATEYKSTQTVAKQWKRYAENQKKRYDQLKAFLNS